MDWLTLLQGGGVAGIIFALGANWMKLDRLARDIDEIKTATGPLPALQATVTHQHEWLERHDRDIHDLRGRA